MYQQMDAHIFDIYIVIWHWSFIIIVKLYYYILQTFMVKFNLKGWKAKAKVTRNREKNQTKNAKLIFRE